MNDDFLAAKLEFPKSVAVIFEPFFRKFQSAKPLAPYVYDEITLLISELAKRFLKDETVKGSDVALNSYKKLVEILNDEDTLKKTMKNAKEIFIGTGAKLKLPKKSPVNYKFWLFTVHAEIF